MFGIRTIVVDKGSDPPREGDRFLMQTFFEKGYSRETLLQLNRVRVYWQALFVLDILTAFGTKIGSKVLGQPRVRCKKSRLRWPTEHLTASNFQTWRDAVMALCPSWNTRTRLGSFIVPTHRIWEWRWDERSGYLCQYSNDGDTDDVLLAGKKTKHFPLFGDTAIHEAWDHLLGGAHARGAGPRWLAVDIIGSGGHRGSGSPDLYGHAPVLG